MSVPQIEVVKESCQNSYEPDANRAGDYLEKADYQSCQEINQIGFQCMTPFVDDILRTGSLRFAGSCHD